MMTFEYVIACNSITTASVHNLLAEFLAEALEASVDEFDDDTVSRMIEVKHGRISHTACVYSGILQLRYTRWFRFGIADNGCRGCRRRTIHRLFVEI